MELHDKLSALIELAESLGVDIRRVSSAAGSAEHSGGAMVRMKGLEIFFIDPTASLADQISALADAMRGREELEDIFLPPELRQAIEGEQE